MRRNGIALSIALLAGTLGIGARADAPRPADPRLIFERIAAEPEIVTPTGIAVYGRGRLLVIESHTHFPPRDYRGPSADRIRVFEDRDGDGRPEPAGVFFEGTRWTMNLAVARDGTVFVATRSAIYRLEDRDADGRADGVDGDKVPEPIVRLDSTGDYPHNGLSGFAFDAKGDVYFGLGENLGVDYRLIGRDGVPSVGGGEGGNIYRCRPDGTLLEKIATGFWNPFHMTFGPAGQLFAVDNDPDSRPPCRLLHIVEGGDYGYRFRNGRRGLHPFTSWNGELPGTLGMVAGTGEAPSGVVDYEASNLPADYRGTLLVTSWGDHRIERYDLRPHGASFRAAMKPVVVGGDDFRPVGITVAADGSLYVSDWVDKSYTLHGKGRIWRLRRNPEGPPERRADLASSGPPPADSSLARAEALRRTADPAAVETLLKGLDSDDPFVQQAAREGLRHSFRPEGLARLAASAELPPPRRLGLLLILRDQDGTDGRALLPKFLADADPTIRFAAIQWIGEHRLESYRPRLLEGLGAPTTNRELFQATLAALEMLDGRRRDARDELAGEDYIAALLRNPATPPTILRRGLRMLRPDHPSLTLSLLERHLGSPDESIRIEAVRSLALGRQEGRFEVMARIAEDRTVPDDLRAEAIAGLGAGGGRGRALLVDLASNGSTSLRREAVRSLRGSSLLPPERERIRAANQGDPATLELVDRLGGDEKGTHAKVRYSSVEEWVSRLTGPADASAGERLFYHAKGPGCYRCHQVDGRGGRAGPDLTNLAASTDRRRLVESIVAPSREVAPQFVSWSVARTDGTVFTGILLEQSADGSMVFADSEGRRISVKPDEIAERQPQKASIMPEDLPRLMTVQEMRDLLAFLGRRASAAAKPVQ